MISLQQASDARIAALQSQLAARSSQLEQVQAQLAAAQRQVASREGEASRLAGLLGAGPDVDRLARDQLAAASEDIILSLNKQVGSWQHVLCMLEACT
jgi:chromosome segregation ATPase